MFAQRVFFYVISCGLVLALATPAFAAADKPAEVARVIAVTPDAFVVRNNARLPLKLKDGLYTTDVISTGNTGKVELLFADDTNISLAPNSTVDIADFSFGGGAKANFVMNLTQGLARVVSGKIVAQNPEGFSVKTPHATIGIRGTILTADVRNAEKTIVILSKIGASSYVGVLNTFTGEDTHLNNDGLSCEITKNGNVKRPSTPLELQIAQSLVPKK